MTSVFPRKPKSMSRTSPPPIRRSTRPMAVTSARRRDNGLLVWGEYLLIAQDILGIEMHERQMLVEILASAKERYEER